VADPVKSHLPVMARHQAKRLRDLEAENAWLKKAVALVRSKHRYSERRICRALGIGRSMVRYGYLCPGRVTQPVDEAECPATIAIRLGSFLAALLAPRLLQQRGQRV
jgi:hypothetical protein